MQQDGNLTVAIQLQPNEIVETVAPLALAKAEWGASLTLCQVMSVEGTGE